MRHPEILLVPILMLLDYYLTLVARIFHQRAYGKQLRVDAHELNPIWQSAIARGHWLNIRHLLLVVLMSSGVVWLFEGGDPLPHPLASFLLGLLFVGSAVLIGRHLANIFMSRYVMRHPGLLEGEVRLSHEWVLKGSQYNLKALLLAFIVIDIFAPSAFVWGGTFSVLGSIFMHTLWLRRYRRQKARLQATQRQEAGATTPEGETRQEQADKHD